MTVDLKLQYETVLTELDSVLEGESNLMARLSTIAGLVNQSFAPRFFWTGFYLVDPEKPKELVVGPYQGTLGCLRIPFGKGVCGAVAVLGETLMVPDVHAFPGHIACDSRSQSEIVVPVFDQKGNLFGVLDVDSTQLDAFTRDDQAGLEEVCKLVFGLD